MVFLFLKKNLSYNFMILQLKVCRDLSWHSSSKFNQKIYQILTRNSTPKKNEEGTLGCSEIVFLYLHEEIKNLWSQEWSRKMSTIRTPFNCPIDVYHLNWDDSGWDLNWNCGLTSQQWNNQ